MKEAFVKARADGSDYHMQYRVRWLDGSLHWLESQGKCQVDALGRGVRIFGVVTDISHRKQAEEAMLRAEKLAVAGRLAASVAHEINNPLEAVANILYLITKTDSAQEARMQASTALDELMRVSLVTQSTLKFHRQTGAPKTLIAFRGHRLRAHHVSWQAPDHRNRCRDEDGAGNPDHLHGERDAADFCESYWQRD